MATAPGGCGGCAGGYLGCAGGGCFQRHDGADGEGDTDLLYHLSTPSFTVYSVRHLSSSGGVQGALGTGARDLSESLNNSDPSQFLVLIPVMKKKIGILKVSIRLSQVAAVPRTADFLMKCASEVRKFKFRDK